jgi:serine-type D-Ala-D-Ala carboxypeptidase/endopeptidase (penicillin-binding protein 4)
MLDLLTAAAVWMENTNVQVIQPAPARLQTNWLLPNDPDANTQVDAYLNRLARQGYGPGNQGVWLQTNRTFLANHQGNEPLSAASITKAVTTLMALKTWGAKHQFQTQIGTTGTVVNGVLNGDLIIQGGDDPMFVWEEAFSLAQALNQLGITQVKGNLVVTGNFAMNFEEDRLKSAQLLRQALDPALWPPVATVQFAALPKGTAKAKVVISGQVVSTPIAPASVTPLIVRRSLPMVDLIRRMNIYSNNFIAQSLTDSLGGHGAMAQEAANLVGVPSREIQLINGSGLGPENKISPRAACGLFQSIERLAKTHNLSVADLFPVAGRDQGTVEDRKLPKGAVVKTGTLWNVSALAGVIPTREHGPVWFAIMNKGENLDGFRNQQDLLLLALAKAYGTPATLAPEFASHPITERLGDPRRNQIMGRQ